MGLLKAYSLADSQGAGSYTMHSGLRQWSRSLSLDADAASLLSVSVCALGNAVPSQDNKEYWQVDRRLPQHTLHSLDKLRGSRKLNKEEPPPWAMVQLGNSLLRQGKLDEADQMYQRALAGREKALGPDHTSTLGTVNNLGNLYRAQGKLDEAEQMLQRALTSYEQALGPDHTSTLSTVNNLGNLYSDQGKLDEAEQMLQRALAGREKALGPDHTSTLGIVNNLGLLYSAQGYLDEAELMYKRALLGYQRIYGPSHDRVAATSEKLASTRLEKGKCDNAQRYDCASGADVAVSHSGLTRDNRARVTGPADCSDADCSVALLICMLCCFVDTEQSAGTNESPWYIERILSLDRSLVLNSNKRHQAPPRLKPIARNDCCVLPRVLNPLSVTPRKQCISTAY